MQKSWHDATYIQAGEKNSTSSTLRPLLERANTSPHHSLLLTSVPIAAQPAVHHLAESHSNRNEVTLKLPEEPRMVHVSFTCPETLLQKFDEVVVDKSGENRSISLRHAIRTLIQLSVPIPDRHTLRGA